MLERFLNNGSVWQDTEGNSLHAHGGDMLYHDGWYYWYGKDRRDTFYVNCYRSKDLLNWEFCNHVLTVNSKTESIGNGADLTLVRQQDMDYGEWYELCIDGEDVYHKVNLERPKVIYNQKTGQYVMWMHFEKGVNYSCARAAIATCNTPDGDFVYHGSCCGGGLIPFYQRSS